MTRASRLNVFIAYADFLLTLLAVALAMIVVETKAGGPKTEAEYLISAEWPKTIDADVDLWGQTPAGKLVFYQDREEGALHLDRDSRGFLDNRVSLAGGGVTYLPEKEIQTVRGLVPGAYTFALHLFAYRGVGSTTDDHEPIAVPVHVEVTALKPAARIVFARDFMMTRREQALNVFAMTIEVEGHEAIESAPLTPLPDLYYARSGRRSGIAP